MNFNTPTPNSPPYARIETSREAQTVVTVSVHSTVITSAAVLGVKNLTINAAVKKLSQKCACQSNVPFAGVHSATYPRKLSQVIYPDRALSRLI